MSWKKKAITVLMTSFLLVTFAIAVGVMIMNFGRAEVESAARCPIEIGLKFANIGGVDQFCYDAAKKDFTFTIENGPNLKVEGLIVNLIGSKKAESFELNDAKLIKTGSYLGHVGYDTAVSGEIRQVKISPKVVLQDEELVCVEQALVAESIKNC